jgi:uridine kinase
MQVNHISIQSYEVKMKIIAIAAVTAGGKTTIVNDTPLDIALARYILRDMENSTGDEIRNSLEGYLKYSRIAYIQMLKDILPSSDYVIDGSLEVDKIIDELIEIINNI